MLFYKSRDFYSWCLGAFVVKDLHLHVGADGVRPGVNLIKDSFRDN